MIGDDLNCEGVFDILKCVVKMYVEVFLGMYEDLKEYLYKVFGEDYEEFVLVKDILFYLMCEYYLVLFYGVVYVVYIL